MIQTLFKIIIAIVGPIIVAALALAAWQQHSAMNAVKAIVFALVCAKLFKGLRRDKNRAQILQGAQGFALSHDEFIQLTAMWIPAAGLFLVFLAYAAITRQGFLIAFSALLAALFYWLFRFTRKYKWVFLSPAGISGWNTNDSKASMLWSDNLSIKSASYKGIAGFRLTNSDEKTSVFIPAGIAES